MLHSKPYLKHNILIQLIIYKHLKSFLLGKVLNYLQAIAKVRLLVLNLFIEQEYHYFINYYDRNSKKKVLLFLIRLKNVIYQISNYLLI